MRSSLGTFTASLAAVTILAAVAAAAPPAKKAPAAKKAAPPQNVKEVVVVFKTHFDIGYTAMAREIVEKYRTTMIDQALAVVDRNRDLPPDRQFVWTIPGWPMHKILEDWPGQKAERRARVEKALVDGRFVVHALPFTVETEFYEPEEMVRGMSFSSQVARRLGLPLPRDAKMTDVPEHTWMLATLLHHAGVEFLHIGCNGMSASPSVPPLYWWEGPDGSRVLTMYSPNYGTGLLPPADWPYKTWLALLHTGDNHGPPRPEEVKAVLDQAAQKLPGVRVRIGRLSDFADAIRAEKAALPVVRADMPETWIHGQMCDPEGQAIARHIRPQIAATEALNTELRGWGLGLDDAAPAVAAAYEQALLYGEHTWGGSIGWLQGRFPFDAEFQRQRAAGRFKRIEASWEEHTDYIKHARDAIAPVLQKNLTALADAVHAPGPRIVVYNPLPWRRDGLVTPRLADADRSRPVKPAEGGEAVSGNAGCFLARNVPAMGYRTYLLDVAPVSHATDTPSFDEKTGTLESRFLKAVVDPQRGTVRSLVDKRTGRELIDSGAAEPFGAFLYERFDADQIQRYVRSYCKRGNWFVDFIKPGLPPAKDAPYRAATPSKFKTRVEQSANAITAVMEAPAGDGIPCGVTTRLILYRDLPYADLEITLRDKPLEPWPEAGWLCLPLKADEPQFRLGRLSSIVDPAKDIVPGANRNMFAINTGVAIVDPQGAGAALCPMDHSLVSLDTPGVWKFSRDFVPKKPVVYLNLFNNQWNTNYRLWTGGTWTSRVRLWSVDRFQPERDLVTPALEARYPLEASYSDKPAGPLPAVQSGVAVSRRGVLVTALGRNPDGPGTVLRVWEQGGTSGQVTVTLPTGTKFTAATPVNLRGQPAGKPRTVRDGKVFFDLPAYAPASFVLE